MACACRLQAQAAAAQEGMPQQDQAPPADEGRSKADRKAGGSSALGVSMDGQKPRNIKIFSSTTKAVYIHFHNVWASKWWMGTDFTQYFFAVICLTVGTMLITRIRSGQLTTTVKAQIGENLLDQRTRDLLNDIETLRTKDPLRLENEANLFHEMFWQSRAKVVAEQRNNRRSAEISRGLLQGEARGTDMTEWLGAKAKDDQEREVARRTHDYIQGFHQHLKSKRLI